MADGSADISTGTPAEDPAEAPANTPAEISAVSPVDDPAKPSAGILAETPTNNVEDDHTGNGPIDVDSLEKTPNVEGPTDSSAAAPDVAPTEMSSDAPATESSSASHLASPPSINDTSTDKMTEEEPPANTASTTEKIAAEASQPSQDLLVKSLSEQHQSVEKVLPDEAETTPNPKEEAAEEQPLVDNLTSDGSARIVGEQPLLEETSTQDAPLANLSGGNQMSEDSAPEIQAKPSEELNVPEGPKDSTSIETPVTDKDAAAVVKVEKNQEDAENAKETSDEVEKPDSQADVKDECLSHEKNEGNDGAKDDSLSDEAEVQESSTIENIPDPETFDSPEKTVQIDIGAANEVESGSADESSSASTTTMDAATSSVVLDGFSEEVATTEATSQTPSSDQSIEKATETLSPTEEVDSTSAGVDKDIVTEPQNLSEPVVNTDAGSVLDQVPISKSASQPSEDSNQPSQEATVNSATLATGEVTIDETATLATEEISTEPAPEPRSDPTTGSPVEITAEPKESAEPAAEPSAGSLAKTAEEILPEPAAEPAKESASEPAAEPVATPVAKLVADPFVEPSPEPVATELIVEPSPAPVAEPVVEPAAEPATEPSPESVAEPAKEPSPESVAEPAPEPAAEPVVDPSSEPVAEPSLELVTGLAMDAAPGAAAGPALESSAEKTTETAEEPNADLGSAPEPLAEPPAESPSDLPLAVTESAIMEEPSVETALPINDPPPTTEKKRRRRTGWERERRYSKSSNKSTETRPERKRRESDVSGSTAKTGILADTVPVRESKEKRGHKRSSTYGEITPDDKQRPKIGGSSEKRRSRSYKDTSESSGLRRPKLLDQVKAESDTRMVFKINASEKGNSSKSERPSRSRREDEDKAKERRSRHRDERTKNAEEEEARRERRRRRREAKERDEYQREEEVKKEVVEGEKGPEENEVVMEKKSSEGKQETDEAMSAPRHRDKDRDRERDRHRHRRERDDDSKRKARERERSPVPAVKLKNAAVSGLRRLFSF